MLVSVRRVHQSRPEPKEAPQCQRRKGTSRKQKRNHRMEGDRRTRRSSRRDVQPVLRPRPRSFRGSCRVQPLWWRGSQKRAVAATVYALERSYVPDGKMLSAIADGSDIPVVRVENVKADVEKVLSTFKRFHIVAVPAWMVDRGQRLRIDRTVDLAEEEEPELDRRADDDSK